MNVLSEEQVESASSNFVDIQLQVFVTALNHKAESEDGLFLTGYSLDSCM